jgi:hypothetical protein
VHAEFPRLLVHKLGKGLLGAGQAFGEHDAGIVAGLDDDTAQQVLDADFRADLDEHLRAAHTPGLLADGQLVLERQPPILQGLEDQVDGHDLAHGCGRHGVMGVLLEQHGPGLGVHQQGLAGRGLEGGAWARRQAEAGR